jgi:hypothetical protein
MLVIESPDQEFATQEGISITRYLRVRIYYITFAQMMYLEVIYL